MAFSAKDTQQRYAMSELMAYSFTFHCVQAANSRSHQMSLIVCASVNFVAIPKHRRAHQMKGIKLQTFDSFGKREKNKLFSHATECQCHRQNKRKSVIATQKFVHSFAFGDWQMLCTLSHALMSSQRIIKNFLFPPVSTRQSTRSPVGFGNTNEPKCFMQIQPKSKFNR